MNAGQTEALDGSMWPGTQICQYILQRLQTAAGRTKLSCRQVPFSISSFSLHICPSSTCKRMSALGSQDVAWYEAFVWANIGLNSWRGEGSLPLTPYLNPGWFKPLDGSNSLFILEHRHKGYRLNLPKDSIQLVPLSMQRELSSSGVTQALVLVLNSFSNGNQDSN